MTTTAKESSKDGFEEEEKTSARQGWCYSAAEVAGLHTLLDPRLAALLDK